MKKIIFIMICLFAFPMISKAIDVDYCTKDEASEVRALASNVSINYDVVLKDDKPIYTIYITNLTDDMLVIDRMTAVTKKGFSKTGSEYSFTTEQGGSYYIDIYSYKCKSKLISKVLALPVYNAYYKDPLCEGLDAYKQCQRWSGYTATREKFESDIKKIKDDIKQKEEYQKKLEKKELSWYEKIVRLFIKFWWVIVLVIALVSFVVYIIRKQQKKKEYDFKL